jgi:hypothetical protein
MPLDSGFRRNDGKKCSLEFVSPAEAGVQSVGFKGRPSSRRCLSYYGLPSSIYPFRPWRLTCQSSDTNLVFPDH